MPIKVEKRKFKDGTESKTYWMRGTVAGAEIFRSTKKSKLSEARKVADKFIQENEQAEDEADERLFIEAAVEYIKHGGEKRYVEKLYEHLGMNLLSEINQELLDGKSREIFPAHENSTIKRQFWAPVIAVMNFAAVRGWCPYKKFHKPVVKDKHIEWAEKEWFEAFWEYANDNLYRITVFLPYTGCRVSEAITLDWSNVSLEGKWAYIEKTKNGESRTVHLADIVVEALSEVKDKTGRVFNYSHGCTVNNAIKKTVTRANKDRKKRGLAPIKYLSSHKIGSHTYGTWMMRDGGLDLKGLTDTGRWKDLKTAARYAHTSSTSASKKSDLLPKISRAIFEHKDANN